MGEELWKDIYGYEGIYKISSKGNIYSYLSNKVLKHGKHTRGYLMIDLCLNKNKKHFFIHRLVAEHFIGNTFDKREVNHKNGVKTDNKVDNLEWVTSSENKKHAYKNGLRKPNTKKRQNLTGVLQIKNGVVVNKHRCVTDAQKNTGILNISACCRGKLKTCGGYKWEYSTRLER